METKEVWKNITNSRIGYLTLDKHEDPVRKQVRGQKLLEVTPRERIYNSDRAATDELDIFNNGWLIPVRLLEDDELSKEVASNPNLLSESDLRDMFKLQWRAFEKRVNEIDTIMILRRLEDLAENDDSINVTVKQSSVIQNRIAELTADDQDTSGEDLDDGDIFSRIKAVSPS